MAERFEVEALGPNTLQFTWGPPGTKNNVIVYNYLLSCKPQPEGFPIVVHSQSDEVKQTLGGFEPDTEYECDIVVSQGGVSGPRVMQTTRTPRRLLCVCVCVTSLAQASCCNSNVCIPQQF